jgi:septal ring factor EnvC (AmiA/AmiB activator)
MEISVVALTALIVVVAVLAWLVSGAVAQRRFDVLLAGLRERLEQLQRELDERVLRIKQLETQQLGLERDIDARRRRISDLELEIGRLRMRIVDLEARGAPAA